MNNLRILNKDILRVFKIGAKNSAKLDVVVVNWNTKGLLSRCVDSIYSNIDNTILNKIILVDNGSVDGSASMIRERYPDIKLIENTDNIGFSAANNKAIHMAESEYLLFVNTDVILTKKSIDKLLEFMERNPKAGLCSPSLMREDGSRQETFISFPTVFTELFGRIANRHPLVPCKVQSVRGACMMARNEIIKKSGCFNERYFFFLEETDLCFRLHKSGYEVWYIPNAQVYHTGGGSAKSEEINARIEYWRSRYVFFKENYPRWKFELLHAGLSIKLILDLFVNFFGTILTFGFFTNNRYKHKLKTYFFIIVWHLAGKPGDWGISSGNIFNNNKWLVRAEFKEWWEKNNKYLTTENDNLRIIKKNTSRKLMEFNNKAYVKVYKRNFIFRKPWLDEWKLINRLRQLCIDTILPIACGNKYFITCKLNDVKPLHNFILDDIKNIEFKEKILFTHSLAGFINKLHKKGVLHGDLHAGNILVQKEPDNYRFYIIDLHRARIKLFLSKNEILDNLVQLDKFFSLEMSRSARMRLFKSYIKDTFFEQDYKYYSRLIYEKTLKACQDLWRKRDRQYLKDGKYGIRGKYNEVNYTINSIYKNIDVKSLIQYVKNPVSDNVIKNSRSSYVSKFNFPGAGDVILKIYKQKKFINYIKDIFRYSRGLRAWQGSWALITRVINTPEPIFAGEMRRFGIVMKSFIITKEITSATNLTLFVKNKEQKNNKDFINSLSSQIKTLYKRGVFQPDMKGSNILVQEDKSGINPVRGRPAEGTATTALGRSASNGGQFYFIDLEHIQIKTKISLDDKLFNIKQIMKSTGLSCPGILSIKRILIVKPSSLGDIVQSLPVADKLRSIFSGASIFWLANRNYIDLLKSVRSIDKIIIFERNRWGNWKNIFKTPFELVNLIRTVRKYKFDIVMDLQGLLRSGFITGFSGAPLRIGFNNAREFAHIFYNNKISANNKIHAHDRYMSFIEYLGLENKDFNYENELNISEEIKNWAEYMWGAGSLLRIIINPGGRWATKRWPRNKYAEVIDKIDEKYKAKIILVGDTNDNIIAEEIVDITKSKIINLCGKTNLLQLAAIVQSSTVLITNDSGPMHLAAYLNKPIMAVFGPTDPLKTGPFGEKHMILKSYAQCSPCFKRHCADIKCMESIDKDQILNTLQELLQKHSAVI